MVLKKTVRNSIIPRRKSTIEWMPKGLFPWTTWPAMVEKELAGKKKETSVYMV
jgi:hypothetical protein